MNKLMVYLLFLNLHSSVYKISFFIFVTVIFLLMVNYLVIKLKASNSSQKNNSKKPTTLSDINKITSIYNLTKEQKDFLIQICKNKQIPNLELNLHSENFCNNFFMTEYYEIRKNEKKLSENEVENKIAVLFALRQKIENAKKNLSNLSSSIAIPEGHFLFLYDNSKEQYKCEIVKNTKDYIIISIPKNILGKEFKPEPLTKLTLYYQTSFGSAYILDSRMIRSEFINDEEQLVITHSNHLKCYQRRKYKRIDINNNCNFSAVKTSISTKDKDKKINYEPLERKHHGKLVEISAGGCSILTDLNIKEKQYIYIEFNLDEKSSDNCIGLIVNTEQNNAESSYILHIVFVNINKKTRNRIFSKVYEYLY